MTEYEELKAELSPTQKNAGFELGEEDLQPDYYGSAFSQYHAKGLSYRIYWNAKGGCGYVQSMEEEDWVSLKCKSRHSI